MQHGCLYRRGRLCIPAHMAQLKDTILHDLHDTPFSGHCGVDKTLARISRHFWWKGLCKDYIQWIAQCKPCQQTKHERCKQVGLLTNLEIPAGKWQSMSADFVTGLPCSTKGNDAVWVYIDRLNKQAHFIPVRSTVSAKALTPIFMQHIFRVHGCPAEIVSDRDCKFTAIFWTAFLRSPGIKPLSCIPPSK